MKINANYKLREIAGENVIVLQGKGGSDLTKIISLNSSATKLYEHFCGKEFETAEVEQLLCDTYGIDLQRAAKDAASWISSLKDCHVISE